MFIVTMFIVTMFREINCNFYLYYIIYYIILYYIYIYIYIMSTLLPNNIRKIYKDEIEKALESTSNSAAAAMYLSENSPYFNKPGFKNLLRELSIKHELSKRSDQEIRPQTRSQTSKARSEASGKRYTKVHKTRRRKHRRRGNRRRGTNRK